MVFMFTNRQIITYSCLLIFILFSSSTAQEVPNLDDIKDSLLGYVFFAIWVLNIIFFVQLIQNQKVLKNYDSKSYTPTIWYIVVGLFFFSCILCILSLIMILIQYFRINSILKSYQHENNKLIIATQSTSYQYFEPSTPNYKVLPPNLPPILPESNLIAEKDNSIFVKSNDKEDYTEYFFEKNINGNFDDIIVNQFDYVKEGEKILSMHLSIHNLIDSKYTIINVYARQSGWVFYKDKIEYGDYFSYIKNECFLKVYKTEESLINAQLNNSVLLKNDLFTKRPIIIGEKYGGSKDGFIFGPFLVYPEYNNGEHRFNILFGGRRFYLYRYYTIILLMESGKLINLDKLVKSTKSNNNIYTEKTYSVITFEDIKLLGTEDIKKIRILNNEGNVELECEPFEKHLNSRMIQKVFRDYINKYISIFLTIDPTDYENQGKDEHRKDKKCYVYLMRDETNLYYKIGISNKPKYRERTLQSEKPTIILICSKEFPTRKIAESFEKALHNAYSKKRIRGEWFKLDENDIKELKETLDNN